MPTFPAPGGLHDPELRLPVEIVECVISAIEDKRVLKTLALSCSRLRESCQSRLFQDFTLNCDCYEDGLFKEGGIVHTIASDHKGSHTNITSLFRRLRIDYLYGPWKRGGEKNIYSMLGKFLEKLVAVERLEFCGAGLEWRHKGLADGLVAALQIPTLRALRLVSLEGFPMSLVLWGRALKRVEFQRVAFLQKGNPAGINGPLATPTLEEFEADNRGMGLSLLGRHILSFTIGQSAFTRLKRLKLEYRRAEGDRPDDINRLLTACQNTLEDLALFLDHDAYPLNELYSRNVNLRRLTNLRTFSTRVYLTTFDGYLEGDHPFTLLKTLFRQCPASLKKVRLVVFHRFGDTGDQNAPEESGWTGLDKVLISMSGLQEVSVVVCCTECSPGQRAAHEHVYDLPLTRAKGIFLERKFTESVSLATQICTTSRRVDS